MLSIDLSGKRALVAGVADDAGFASPSPRHWPRRAHRYASAHGPRRSESFKHFFGVASSTNRFACRTAASLNSSGSFPSTPTTTRSRQGPVEVLRNKRYKDAGDYGSAGLRSTWAALEAGKTVALANKETLVMAGPVVMRLAAERGGTLVPVDSEHSEVFQAFASWQRRARYERIILTASGGPFRRHNAAQLAKVTVANALKHPTWDMGLKITMIRPQ